MKFKEKVCVIGLGYIGLPTAALLANRGYAVTGVDILQKVVDTINSGEVHIVEPELDVFVKSAVQSGNLKAYVKPMESDIFMIAVPTPIDANHKPNINYVLAASKAIAPYLKPGNLVILESTSPVGTTDKVCEMLTENGADVSKLHIAYCPERVLPGKTMRELVENDRVVGGMKPEDSEKVKDFYSTFVQGQVLVTNARTAEMAKLTENAYRDTNIAFANELSIICDQNGVNVWELIELANHHPRVNILKPGSGVGGHCIAVDPWFIVSENEKEAQLIRTARERNDYKTQWVVEKIKKAYAQSKEEKNKEPKIACMGLAFKPDIDDLRESPALLITRILKGEGYDVLPVEPNIESYQDWKLYDYEDALQQADIICYLVSHKEFSTLEEDQSKIVLDFCGVKN